MQPGKTRAVIDVGTNSIKLLVGVVEGANVTPLVEQSEQTRLGRGFYTDHMLRPDAIAATAQAVAGFAEIARSYAPESVHVIATSAARDAINKGDLLLAIEQASGLPVEIISGEQEAAWAYCGATMGGRFDKAPALVVDIGGGSTELNLGNDGSLRFSKSFPLGTVRLLEMCEVSDPPTAEQEQGCQARLREFIQEKVQPLFAEKLAGFLSSNIAFVVTGGTATILGRVHLGLKSYERDRLDGLELDVSTIRALNHRFWTMSLAERKEIPGMPGKRADVILGGSAILLALMEMLQLPTAIVSTRGLRFAALLDGGCAALKNPAA
ncbi:MAG TPA: Ppx/GppA phosphatase family protein [Methylomirabilota bacterium]|nr:Ppx/GppA phosphatase family protein [Methylomirabilota bacterium]